MADDSQVAEFVDITEASTDKARQYLNVSDGNLEQAITLFFTTGGIDLEGPPSAAANPPDTSATTAQAAANDDREVIHIDSDDEISDDNDPQITGYTSRAGRSTGRGTGRTGTQRQNAVQPVASQEDDEAIARRLQEEFYGSTGGANPNLDAEGYRAPIAGTRETLVGPDYDLSDPSDMHEVVLQQVRERQQARRRGGGAAGIFNQRDVSSSIWNNDDGSTGSSARREALARATGGASETSSKANLLAELFRPPFELISSLSWDEARSQGKEESKWMLVNVQDPAIFACQALNRDIWKHPEIRDTVRENFIFLQYSKDDPRGNSYFQYYFQSRDSESAYPHIAIVDPRTGEQVKVWPPGVAPRSQDFLMQLHEFLDRYSLNTSAKNPVAKRKPESKKSKDIDKMSEEEMLEMALKNSLAAGETADGEPSEAFDPDDLTRSVNDIGKGKDKEDVDEPMEEVSATSPFTTISASNPHEEPATGPTVTRIQFKHPSGRIVRRFNLSDPVRRLYEWLKASPLEGKEGVPFELVAMQKNLIGSLDETVEQASLKNGTVMVEFIED